MTSKGYTLIIEVTIYVLQNDNNKFTQTDLQSEDKSIQVFIRPFQNTKGTKIYLTV